MATHSSVLAWRIPGTEEPGRLPSLGSHRVGHDWSNLAAAAAAAVSQRSLFQEEALCDVQKCLPGPRQSPFCARLGWSFSSLSTLLLRILKGTWRLRGPQPAPPHSPCFLFFVYLPWISWVNENWLILIIVFIQALILGKMRLKTHSFMM